MNTTIPKPLDHLPVFLNYISAMNEKALVTPRGTTYRWLSYTDQYSLTANHFKSMYCPPIEERAADIIDAVEEIRSLKLDKVMLDFTEHPLNKMNDADFQQIFSATNIVIHWRPAATFLIDLKDAEWRPNKKVRQNVRNFEELGYKVAPMSSEDIGEYHAMYLDHRKALNLEPWPRGCFTFIGSFIDAGSYVYGLKAVSPEGKMVAAMSFFVGEGWVEEVHVARVENLPPQCYPIEPIRVRAIEIAKGKGQSYYDLGGVDPNPEPGSKEEGIRRSKEKYNGQYNEFRRFTSVIK